MRIRSTTYAMALVAVCAVTAGSCGGNSVTSKSSNQTKQSSTTQGTKAASSSGTGGSGFFANADCRQLARAFDQGDFGSTLTSGQDPTKSLRATADFLKSASDKAPSEIADDVRVLADAYAELADRAAEVDWKGIRAGNPSAAAGAAQLGQAFADRRFATAAQHFSAYVAQNCTR